MAAANPGSSLGAQAFRGVSWSSISFVARRIIAMVSVGILAHLLPPTAYGLLAMGNLMVAFLDNFKDLGTTSAIIYREELEDGLLTSVFWTNIAFAAMCSLLLYGSAPLMAAYFREPQVTAIVRALSITFFVSAFSMVHMALLSRAMNFKRVAVIEVASDLCGAAAAITFALRGAGVWSLVASSITSGTVMVILSWALAGWRPGLHLPRWKLIQPIASYSMNLVGFSMINYVARNADNMIVGRFLGTAALGYYQMAYLLMLYPVQGVAGVVGRVLFSTFTRMQNDNARFRSAYLRVVTAMGATSFPMVLGLLVTAEPFVRILLGDKWVPIVPILMILIPVGVMQAVGVTVGQIYQAKGRTDWMFRWGILATTCNVIAFLIGVQWGTKGVALAYLVMNLLLLYPNFAIPFKLIELPFGQFVHSVKNVLGLALFMALVAGSWHFALRQMGVTNAMVLLASTVAVGVIVYVPLLLRMNPPGVADVIASLPVHRLPFLRRFQNA
jgi:O-antigen/teichoic acid export membrane protein